MPMYEYVCGSCRHSFEQIQSFHDEPLTVCPECGGSVRRVISSVGIIFKGSGWYINDSRRQITTTKVKAGDTGKESADSAKDGGDVAAAAASAPSKGESGSDTGAASPSDKKTATGDGATKADKSPAKESTAAKWSRP